MDDLPRLCAERMGWKIGPQGASRTIDTFIVWSDGDWDHPKGWYLYRPKIVGSEMWDPEHNIQDAWVLVEHATENHGLEFSIEIDGIPESRIGDGACKALVQFTNEPFGGPREKARTATARAATLEKIPRAVTKAFLEATE